MTSKSAPLGVRNVERPRPLRSVSHIGIPASSTNMANAGMNDDRRMSAQDVGSGTIIYLNILVISTASLLSVSYKYEIL